MTATVLQIVSSPAFIAIGALYCGSLVAIYILAFANIDHFTDILLHYARFIEENFTDNYDQENSFEPAQPEGCLEVFGCEHIATGPFDRVEDALRYLEERDKLN